MLQDGQECSELTAQSLHVSTSSVSAPPEHAASCAEVEKTSGHIGYGLRFSGYRHNSALHHCSRWLTWSAVHTNARNNLYITMTADNPNIERAERLDAQSQLQAVTHTPGQTVGPYATYSCCESVASPAIPGVRQHPCSTVDMLRSYMQRCRYVVVT